MKRFFPYGIAMTVLEKKHGVKGKNVKIIDVKKHPKGYALKVQSKDKVKTIVITAEEIEEVRLDNGGSEHLKITWVL